MRERASDQARTGCDSLVARAGQGDHDAFALLIETRLDRVFRTANAILGNEADARDVTQDACASAWVHLPNLRDTDRFDAWLNKVVLNRCRDLLRHRRRRPETTLDGMELSVAGPTSSSLETGEISAAFDRLSPGDRQVLVLHHLHGLPVADLARQLKIPTGTAKWRLYQARQTLSRLLEAEE